MAAFVSSFSGAKVGARAEFASEAVCARAPVRGSKNALVMIQGNAKASVNMPAKASTRGRRTVAFNARVARNRQAAAGIISTADDFFARSVTMQYKAFACPTGVYTPQCTEGTYKGAAFEKRAMALSAAFRLKQRSPAAKAHALFENRRRAIIASEHECHYEESLFVRYPKLAAAFVLGKAEAMRTCSRYVQPETVEEEYMAAAVDKQMKMRGARGGVYSSSCVEGNQKGQAEQARVHGLAAAFRAAQKSPAQKSGERYAAAKYGRLQFAHGCEHEEQEFNKYPACAAAMRSTAYGY
eukprot:CAMPEP_0185841454 /NCGR_PEP_ID=MMETSP1353-20130828/17903_1 /TAXON_ID=1077150 /ORGANISM="Erythrolobus australicus, Strain CCMP3124" /LENGTH=296 /DNA_ID=CAMNT_0028540929 /DNA_START=152 /DNA_END=1042 /DNA_ORIENTATION=+